MTILFSVFGEKPPIVRLYWCAKLIHKNYEESNELFIHFQNFVGARQILKLNVELVQASCGTRALIFDYVEYRK
jgi:hypothetical protein